MRRRELQQVNPVFCICTVMPSCLDASGNHWETVIKFNNINYPRDASSCFWIVISSLFLCSCEFFSLSSSCFIPALMGFLCNDLEALCKSHCTYTNIVIIIIIACIWTSSSLCSIQNTVFLLQVLFFFVRIENEKHISHFRILISKRANKIRRWQNYIFFYFRWLKMSFIF